MGHILLLLLPLLTVTASTDDGELVFVNILYRHGARTPTRNYPTDPYNITAWNGVGWGQLLNKGKQQQYRLGKWLRQRYDGFLPTSYKETDIYVQSTDVDRTLMSAYSNLAGLYGPDTNNWSKDIKWQPIPVHIVPKKLDNVDAFYTPTCQKFIQLYKDLQNTKEIRKINDDNQLLFLYASKNSGLEIKNIVDLAIFYDLLNVEEENGLKLPAWTLPIYPQPMKDICNLAVSLASYTQDLARLNSGNLIQDLFKHFTDKINGVITQKVWVYSGHDMTLSFLMKALGIYELRAPYCSTLMIELRRKADDYFVLFKFMNSTNADIEPYILQIPGCESLCPLTKLSELVEPIIPTDLEKECQL